MVINYDNFYPAPTLTDDYIFVVRGLAVRYYASATRYTTRLLHAAQAHRATVPLGTGYPAHKPEWPFAAPATSSP
jgi:hypothetical protein